jgi:hypothetical protein
VFLAPALAADALVFTDDEKRDLGLARDARGFGDALRFRGRIGRRHGVIPPCLPSLYAFGDARPFGVTNLDFVSDLAADAFEHADARRRIEAVAPDVKIRGIRADHGRMRFSFMSKTTALRAASRASARCSGEFVTWTARSGST